MNSQFLISIFCITLTLLLSLSFGDEPATSAWKTIEPLLSAKCYRCHGGEKTEGDVDLKSLATDPKITEEFELWDRVQESVESGDMPPPSADPLVLKEKEAISGWVKQSLEVVAAEFSGDPGPVTMRRLTNEEYDRTIRDLTGQDFGLAKEFQTEAGGGEGFSNIGDVMFLSPAAMDKYFSAARQLADHTSIMPGTGLVFHGQRIGLRGAEQLKSQAEQGLYVWYQQKAAAHLPSDTEDLREGDYMLACWKHQYFKTPLEALAIETGLKLPFLQNWWNLLNNIEPKSRFLDLVRVRWRALPGADANNLNDVPAAVTEQIAAIRADHRSWNNSKKAGDGIQRQQQDADGIRPYPMVCNVDGHSKVHLCIGDIGDGNVGDIALIPEIIVKLKTGSVNYFEWLKKEIDSVSESLAATPLPANADELRNRLEELKGISVAFGTHPQQGRMIEPQVLALAAPQVFTLTLPPNAVQVSAITKLDLQNPEVDKATIQWEMTTGTPRNVKSILPGVLTIWKVSTDAAWDTMRDFSVMREAFPDMFERRLEVEARNLYRDKPSISVYYFSDEQLGQILGERDRMQLMAMKKDWRYVGPANLSDGQKREYDDAMVEHLIQFAAKAWRRLLSTSEKATLNDLYHEGRAKELDRESAAREVLVRILVSPYFLFKAETLPFADEAELLTRTSDGDIPLTAWEVASRLSYFLWASLPDEELRKASEDGSLLKPEVLVSQSERMLKDPRSSALSHEFAGQWLKFRGFKEEDGVDLQKFPEMTPEIRSDMQREAIEFFTRLFQEDRHVTDVVVGETTFLNERLAKFYDVPDVTGNEFREVNVSKHHRGGLLGMGAILTETSRPIRTSPVLRGNYLYSVVLGHNPPPPPPNVPKLDESALKPASLREALMIHRQDKACSVCHDRIDPLGFALESYDAVGRFRATDESGSPIDNTGSLRDGTQLDGMDGLRKYLTDNKDLFIGNFSRKLLGYALGREVLPSDTKLLQKMKHSLQQNDGKVSALVVEIVNSRQFLNRRYEVPVAIANP